MRLIAMLSCALIWTTAPAAEVPNVAADIAPVHSLVAQVMDGVGTPDLILRPGASPHGYALRPSEAAALARADLVVWIGAALTPWLEGAVENLAGDAAQVELLAAEKTIRHDFRDGADFTAQDHEGHGHEGIDPHAWLDPRNAQVWLRLIAQELSALDPENTEIYSANATAGVSELDALILEIDQHLTPVRGVRFLVFHDAYQYFEARFDMPATGAISAGDAAKPGPARIAALRKLVTAQGVTCVLTEPQFNPRMTDTVFPEGVTTGVLDPMGVDVTPGKGQYRAILRAMAAGFAACAP